MGWSFVYSMEGRDTPKAYLDGIYTWSNAEADVRVLKSAVRGRVYYAAVERRSRTTDERIVFAGVCLFRSCPKARDGTVFGYKSMDETVGPCERHCPAGILDLLTETHYPYAIPVAGRLHIKSGKSNPGAAPASTQSRRHRPPGRAYAVHRWRRASPFQGDSSAAAPEPRFPVAGERRLLQAAEAFDARSRPQSEGRGEGGTRRTSATGESHVRY